MNEWKDEDVVTTDFRSLKQGMREAAQAEQERIIKLLEVLAEVTGYVEIEYNQLISLIKGEQK